MAVTEKNMNHDSSITAPSYEALACVLVSGSVLAESMVLAPIELVRFERLVVW